MLILSIDTTGEDCAVRVCGGGAEPVERRETAGRGHAERLAPMVADALSAAGAATGDLARIGVATGPGSFAGIRVGVAFTRGLALTLGVPAIGVSLFDLWARGAGPVPLLGAVHDARRGEVAWRVYRGGNAEGPAQRAPGEAAAEALAALMAEDGLVLAGSAAAALAARIPGVRALPHGPADLAHLAALTAEAGPDAGPPAPFYVRPPDAKLPGGRLPADAS